MVLAEDLTTSVGLVQVLIQGGCLGLLVVLLRWGLPRVIKYMEDRDVRQEKRVDTILQAHAEERTAILELHAAERKEFAQDRRDQTAAMNRLCEHIERLEAGERRQ